MTTMLCRKWPRLSLRAFRSAVIIIPRFPPSPAARSIRAGGGGRTGSVDELRLCDLRHMKGPSSQSEEQNFASSNKHGTIQRPRCDLDNARRSVCLWHCVRVDPGSQCLMERINGSCNLNLATARVLRALILQQYHMEHSTPRP
ncbi:hypothetical protein JOB18_017117 [Solea senegalensis]|uniref:Uncharacterized protein n=1 Tax=Solea senegalensis TaxID=28829 RepID=A0AAV6SZ45_SOLSE|nr:hypothetical protein JOB18_017117 [Solea senegalensis]